MIKLYNTEELIKRALAGALDEETCKTLLWKSDLKQVDEETLDYTDWTIVLRTILENPKTGKHYALVWENGAIEEQESDFDVATFNEVIQKPVTTLEWVDI